MRKTLTALSALILAPTTTYADVLPDFTASVAPYVRNSFESDLNDAVSFSVLRSGASVSLRKIESRQLNYGLSAELEYSHYDANASFPDDFLFFDLRPSIATYLNERFGIYGGAVLSFGGEPDADVADGLTYGAFIGFNYKVADNVWIGTGIGVTTQLEDDLLFVPLITLDWTIHDRLSLSAEGLSVKLAYKVDDQWTVFLDGRYEFRQFRLNDNAIVPEGVLSDESIPVTIGVTYSPSDSVSMSLAGGAVVWREVRFFDDDENELTHDTADITPFIAVSAKIAW